MPGIKELKGQAHGNKELSRIYFIPVDSRESEADRDAH
jgi:hypothetical protein